VSWLLNIDTAVQTASVCLAKDYKSVGLKINLSQNDHASWLQPAIAALLSEHNLSIDRIDAIAVSAGPGSYT
jgi:tRNA threonylcarbamoyladenosine biosynthesis protein TsaB